MRLGRSGKVQSFWQDRDKRRALLLSVVLHLGLLLLFMLFYRAPELSERPDALIIDVGPSVPAASQAVAEEGVAEETAVEEGVAEEAPPVSEADSGQAAPNEAQEAIPSAAELTEDAQPVPATQAEAQAEVQASPGLPQAETAPPPPETAAVESPPPVVAPVAEPASPVEASPAVPEATPEATVAAPEAAQTETSIPLPELDLTLPLTVDVTAEASLELAPARPVEVQAEVVLENLEEIPQETVEEPVVEPQAEVVEPQPLEPPPVQVEVAQAQVELAPERPLEVPQAGVEVAQAQDVSLQAELELVEPQPILSPQPQVEVEQARSVTVPDVELEVATERPLEVPQPQVEVAQVRSVIVPEPQVEVAAPQPVAAEPVVEVAQPAAQAPLAVVAEPEGAETAPLAEAPGTPAPGAVADQPQDQPQSAARGFIVTPLPEAQVEGTVEEAVEDTVEDTVEDQRQDPVEETVESTPGNVTGETPLESYEDLRNRPIMAIIDNADPAYRNQSGLKEASAVYEMPVEGELTRLMTVYDRADPESVGPIRSARDYQHTVAEDLGGVLVHAGGSPAALNAIARGRALSYDALKLDALFRRESRLERPYNLFSSGSQLRDTLRGSGQDGSRTLRGAVYRPAPDAPGSASLTVRYPGGYSSGFRYLPELNLYRWQRSGVPAVDVSGESVVVQAVVVASVATQRIMGDAEGRLAMSISEGEATLYLGGKRIDGRWQQRGGFRFTTRDGQTVDLAPFKTWIVMVPPWAQVGG